MNNEKDVLNRKFDASDFELVQDNRKISDTKFESKPTTFFKDSMKRFAKNKSSIVGAVILGILVLLAIFVPVISPYNIDNVSKKEQFLAPKLFEAGTGFWDGTRDYVDIVYDEANDQPAGFYKPAVLNLKVSDEKSYIDNATAYGKGGYIYFEHGNDNPGRIGNKTLASQPTEFTSTDNYTVDISMGNEDNISYNTLGEYRIYIDYGETEEEQKFLVLKDWSKEYLETMSFNISEIMTQNSLTNVNGRLVFELKPAEETNHFSYILIKSVEFKSDVENEDLESISFTDATKMALVELPKEGKTPKDYWVCTGRKGVHASEVRFCSFTYDTYAAAYDEQIQTYAYSDYAKLEEQGLCKLTYKRFSTEFTFDILDPEKCPIKSVDSIVLNSKTGKLSSINALVPRYRSMGYDKMPKFLFGTDNSGQDLFKKAFAGLRTSLLLGVGTALFCFIFGLIWGSISGYFGGNVDLFMERFCEILSGVPWIVVMTLCILHLGNGLGTFFLALCLTGWMSTAARTRTQFYRFKGREYVLASRTLGSSDIRLIFKHILPNSLGTIITSSVFMITSVIFSEASLAYLNLGLQGAHSFGVMISENQQYISSAPNLVVFPAVIISLMMISFNLFGNGLRDAVNPSLKGSE